MKNIKLIATDMDHTLLTDEGNLPPHFFELLDRVKKEGIYFALASGRPLATLEAMFPEHLNEFIFICDNGGLIKYQGETLYKSLITTDDYHQLIRYMKSIATIPVLCGIKGTFIEKNAQKYEDFFPKFYKKLKFVDNLEELEEPADKVTAYLPNENSREVYNQYFYPEFDADFSVAVSDSMWIDLMNKEVDKGAAIHQISQYLNISTQDMMAFGDGDNDIQLLDAVGVGVAVKNATDGVKEHADSITASNNEYGVSQKIEELLSNRASN